MSLPVLAPPCSDCGGVLAPDGRLVFAGTRDGPLTHTESAMQLNEGFLGATTLAVP